MMAGETVSQILNAESAGFVLTFSTGRLAYLRVRDGHGRPNISIQFLRGSSGPLAGGIFGSLRNVLSSSAWRGDIAAVRAGPQEHVGERNVVVATGKGRLQLWNLQRDGQNYLRSEAEGRESIVMAIKKAEPSLGDLLLETFEILDLTFTPKSMIDDIDAQGAHLLLLTSLTSRRSSYYTLVNVVLNKDQLLVGNVRLLKSYTTPVNVHAISKPRLYLPEPGLVAYAVFDRAVVVLSMAKRPESPELQLRSDAHILPPSFEDVVDFRDDPNVEIVGSGMEEPQGQPHGLEEAKARKYKAKHPAAVLLVRGGGVLRVAATDIDKLTSSKAQQVTAKSKLEQAVFFGTMAQNPLSFTGRAELQFPPEEVGAAALELSMDILKSKTPYIPSVPASIEQNLRQRSAALHDLARHLKVTGVALDRVTRWKLLWDAEKMAAATIIWKNYDARVREQPEGQKRGLFTDLVEHIHEDYKSNPVAEEGELDRVRHYFINDIHDLQLAIPWSWQIIKYSYQDGSKNHATVLETLSQANDVAIGALGGAFDFRTTNMDLYGLGNEVLRHGILEDGYDGLPEFWTSTYYIAESTRKQADLTDMLLREFWDKPVGENYPEPHVVDKIRLENPTLIDMAIRTNNERIRWVSAQDDPQLQLQAGQLQALQLKSEDKQIQSLADTLDLPDEAMNLAEKHEILSTLASVLMFEVGITADKLRTPGISQEDFDAFGHRMQALTNRMDKYFAKFGATWATALYEFFVERGLMRQMLDEYQNHREFLTKFLREKPEYAKIGWIHEITRERDYDEAAEMLLNLGLEREQDVWSKKVELSLGKLAHIAGQKRSQGSDESDLVRANQELGLIRIQDQIFRFIYPSIDTAIDDKAEVQLALEIHGNKGLKQQSFMSLLEEAMAHLVKHEAMNALTLIDLLTLMGDNSKPLEDDILSYEKYYLALEASRLGISDKEERQLVQRVIWRRCFLRDDWSELNNTESKDDQQVSDHLRTTALYWTLRVCFKNRKSPKQPLNLESSKLTIPQASSTKTQP
jgi:nuclear pore complex protein Nup133